MIVLCYTYYYIFRFYKRTFKFSNFTYQFFFYYVNINFAATVLANNFDWDFKIKRKFAILNKTIPTVCQMQNEKILIIQ